MEKEINLDLVVVAFDWTHDLLEDYCNRENIELDEYVDDIQLIMSDKVSKSFESYVLKGGASLPDSLCFGLKEHLSRLGMDFDEIACRPIRDDYKSNITSEERNAVMNWLDESLGRHKFEQDFRHAYEDLKVELEKEEEDYD